MKQFPQFEYVQIFAPHQWHNPASTVLKNLCQKKRQGWKMQQTLLRMNYSTTLIFQATNRLINCPADVHPTPSTKWLRWLKTTSQLSARNLPSPDLELAQQRVRKKNLQAWVVLKPSATNKLSWLVPLKQRRNWRIFRGKRMTKEWLDLKRCISSWLSLNNELKC